MINKRQERKSGREGEAETGKGNQNTKSDVRN